MTARDTKQSGAIIIVLICICISAMEFICKICTKMYKSLSAYAITYDQSKRNKELITSLNFRYKPKDEHEGNFSRMCLIKITVATP
jgi:hypothetical protein